MCSDVIRHYDLLIDEGNDPVHDPEPLSEYMDLWDGATFIEKLELDRASSVLEIGVGTGRLAIRTAPLCGAFCGVDISPKTIGRAQENLSNHDNVELLQGDLLTIELNKTFDVIYSSLTFMHIKDKQRAFARVADLLAHGGRFVLSIDKNQDPFIDFGTRRVAIYPDRPAETAEHIRKAGLTLAEQFETGSAHIFVAVKQ